jgi:hypothetical protein
MPIRERETASRPAGARDGTHPTWGSASLHPRLPSLASSRRGEMPFWPPVMPATKGGGLFQRGIGTALGENPQCFSQCIVILCRISSVGEKVAALPVAPEGFARRRRRVTLGRPELAGPLEAALILLGGELDRPETVIGSARPFSPPPRSPSAPRGSQSNVSGGGTVNPSQVRCTISRWLEAI